MARPLQVRIIDDTTEPPVAYGGADVTKGAFWDDLSDDLQDPEFRRHYLLETERVAAIDRMVNQLDDIRESLGLSKADLAADGGGQVRLGSIPAAPLTAQ